MLKIYCWGSVLLTEYLTAGSSVDFISIGKLAVMNATQEEKAMDFTVYKVGAHATIKTASFHVDIIRNVLCKSRRLNMYLFLKMLNSLC